MSDLPDQIDLPPPKWRLAILSGALILMAAVIGGLAQFSHTPILWLIAAADFALGLFFLSGLTRGIGVSLDRDGFTVRGMFGEERRNWSDVSEFHIGRAGKTRAIRFDDTTKTGVFSDAQSAVGRGNSRISRLVLSGRLEDVCAQLNAFRARAVGPRR